ncbi:MAG: aldo/keto reductase [Candidatus Aadella gelida]|nr:aldo/keto reductase [Candidatus Aadella gelida]
MKYRKIGNTDLEVSAIALGSWVFGGEGWGKEVDDNESIRVIGRALDLDINIIDTAPIYGDGRAEEVIGKAIRGRRKDAIIATKCGLEKSGRSIKCNLTAGFIRKEIENSLRRLNIETVDLYQCHWPDKDTPLEETFSELNKIKKEGKIRYIGVSNFDKKLLEEANSITQVVSNQVQYSLFDRDIEKDLISFCGSKGISILSYGSLGGGILTGKYKEPPVFEKGDVRSFFYKYYKEPFWSRGKAMRTTLEKIASKRNVPTAQAAINWVLAKGEVASCIMGCRTEDQLMVNIDAASWELSKEEISDLV